MDRDHERNSVIHLGEDPAEMAVPRIAMHEIGVDVCEIESVASRHRTENRLERLWTSELPRVDFKAVDLEISLLELLIAETAHLDRHRLRELSREIIDMHSGTAIDVRRIFVREEERLHSALLNARGPDRTQIHYQCFTFKSSTGISTLWRTRSAVLP